MNDGLQYFTLAFTRCSATKGGSRIRRVAALCLPSALACGANFLRRETRDWLVCTERRNLGFFMELRGVLKLCSVLNMHSLFSLLTEWASGALVCLKE